MRLFTPADAPIPPAASRPEPAAPDAPSGDTPDGAVLGAVVLAAFRRQMGAQRRTSEIALAQLPDDAFGRPLGALDPPGVQVKHLAGSLRSRFTDFLTTDGEKDDRHRDAEFTLGRGDTRDALMDRWGNAWDTVDATLAGLTPADLDRTVTIRAEPYAVVDALARALGHASYHTGQIVALAKHAAGEAWQTVSIPRGGSEAFTRDVRARHGA